MADTIKIGGELESIATGNVVAATSAIKDKVKNKYQNEINAETDVSLADRYTKAETYNKTELNNMITTPNQEYVTVIATDQTTDVTDVLPATGSADTVYRVGNWDGSQYDVTCYSEYAWNGSTYIKLSTKEVGIDDEPTVESENLVKSGGIYKLLYNTFSYTSSDFTYGYFYNLSEGVGGTAPKSASSSSQDVSACLRLVVKAGQIINLRTIGRNSGRAYALTDVSRTILSVAPVNADYSSGITLNVVQDGYLYVNTTVTFLPNVSVVISSTKPRIDKLEDDVSELKNAATFDISEYNNTPYETLSEALNAVPTDVKIGGRSIKFKQITPATYTVVKTEGLTEQPAGTEVQEALSLESGTYTAAQMAGVTPPESSSVTYYLSVTVDETTTYTTWVITKTTSDVQKYVQYRLMTTEWSNVVSDWQGVGDEPIKDSHNLVESGGVYKKVHILEQTSEVYEYTRYNKMLKESIDFYCRAGSKLQFRLNSDNPNHENESYYCTFRDLEGNSITDNKYFKYNTDYSVIFDTDVYSVNIYVSISAITVSTDFDFHITADKVQIERNDLDKGYLDDKYVPVSKQYTDSVAGISHRTNSITLDVGEKKGLRIFELNIKKGSLIIFSVTSDKTTSFSIIAIAFTYSDGTVTPETYYSLNNKHIFYAEKDCVAASAWISAVVVQESATTFVFEISAIRNIEHNLLPQKYSPIFNCDNLLTYPISFSIDRSGSKAAFWTVPQLVDIFCGITDQVRTKPNDVFAYKKKLQTGKDKQFGERPPFAYIGKHFVLTEEGVPTTSYDNNITTRYEAYVRDYFDKYNGITEIELDGNVFTYEANWLELGNEIDSSRFMADVYLGVGWADNGVPAINQEGNRMYDDQDRPLFYYREIGEQQAFIALRLAYQVIKSVNPNAIVLSYSSTSLSHGSAALEFLRNYLNYRYIDGDNVEHRVWEYFDVLNSHYYCDHEPYKYMRIVETFIKRLSEYKAILNEYNTISNGVSLSEKPLRITEFGITNGSILTKEESETEEEFIARQEERDEYQAAAYVEGVLYGYSLGCEVVNLWKFFGAETSVIDTNSDGTAITKYYPSYYAILYLHSLLTDGCTRPVLTKQNNYFMAEWTSKGRNIKCCWTTDFELNYIIDSITACDIRDMYGNTISTNNGIITISRSPIYFIDCANLNLVYNY